MQGVQKRNSTGHFLVLAGLWFINILIVIFGSPFLIYKKIRAVFAGKSKPKAIQNSKSAQYFPRQIDSKL